VKNLPLKLLLIADCDLIAKPLAVVDASKFILFRRELIFFKATSF
jgi:hypothetical protein